MCIGIDHLNTKVSFTLNKNEWGFMNALQKRQTLQLNKEKTSVLRLSLSYPPLNHSTQVLVRRI